MMNVYNDWNKLAVCDDEQAKLLKKSGLKAVFIGFNEICSFRRAAVYYIPAYDCLRQFINCL